MRITPVCVCSYRLLYVSPGGYVVVVDVVVIDVIDMFGASCNNMFFFCFVWRWMLLLLMIQWNTPDFNVFICFRELFSPFCFYRSHRIFSLFRCNRTEDYFLAKGSCCYGPPMINNSLKQIIEPNIKNAII